VFELLNTYIVHAWVVAPSSEEAEAIGNSTYNKLQDDVSFT